MSVTPAQPSDPALVELVVHCLERYDREGEAALEDICTRHPEHANAIRARIETLRSAGLLASHSGERREVPERLGDFRLLELLGAGGMGVVYSALQESLGRRVALKLIRPEHLYFKGLRERFRREIEIVARLQHPNIVPIFTVGEEGGIPFYAMEQLEGATLAEVLREFAGRRPERLDACDLCTLLGSEATAQHSFLRGSWVQVCLRIVLHVAEAIDHAHRRGVLHRDIKPSNVMLTRDGRVLLLDFGLASSEDAVRLTRTDTQPGSLPYMAPEQLSGGKDAVDARTDVYACGVTLYELLSLGPAFSGSSSRITRGILDGSSQPLRARNPAVPWEAEAICLTAMDRNPARRYRDAAALARDIRNFLELRPIEARRPGAWLRARRWSQRRPALATALLLGLLLLVGGPLLYAFVQKAAAERVQAAYELARQERDRAEESLRATLEAVERMLVPMAQAPLAHLPQIDSQRREILEHAVAIYQRLLAQKPRDPLVRRATASGFLRLGKVYRQVGELDAAEGCYREAFRAFAALVAEEPQTHEFAWLLAGARSDLAHVHLIRGEVRQAQEELEAAVAILESLVDQHPGNFSYERDLAAYLMNLASLHGSGARFFEARPRLRRAIEVFGALVERSGRAPREVQSLCNAICNLAEVEVQMGDQAVAREMLFRARELQREVLTGFPGRPGSLAQLARIELSLGQIAASEGRSADARAGYGAAIETLEGLVRGYPERHQYLRALVQSLTELAEASAEAGELATARRHIERALEQGQALPTAAAEIPEYNLTLARAHESMARRRAQAREARAARDHWLEALALLCDLPANPALFHARGRIRLGLSNLALACGRPAWPHYWKGALETLRALHSAPEMRAVRLSAADGVELLVWIALAAR